MVVGDQGSGGGLAGGPVVPDRAGEREQALPDPSTDAVDGAPAVEFEVDWPLRVSKTDSISRRTGLSRCFPGAGGRLRRAVAAGLAQQPHLALGQERVALGVVR